MKNRFQIILALLCISLLAPLQVQAGGNEDEDPNIKVIHAEGKIFYNEIYVQWTTEYEKVPCEFMIERSVNGSDWSLRGRVKASGKDNGLSEYTYVDSRDDEFKFYRIRKLDAATGSKVLKEFELENYSIQVDLHNIEVNHTKSLVMEYSIDKVQGLLLRIYNNIGEEVVTKLLPPFPPGEILYHLDVSNLQKGNYLLVITQTLLDKSVAEKQFTLK